MKFSQRTGLIPVGKDIQIESIDGDLKNALWNVFDSFVVGRLKLEKVSQFFMEIICGQSILKTLLTLYLRLFLN